MFRRQFLAAPALLLGRAAAAEDPALAALRAGGTALLLRHAATEPGLGDPPGFRLGDCRSQRQLSAEGRAQARAIGAWLAARGLAPARVRASAWCRCLDTATLAFGQVDPWPALNSFFADRAAEGGQSATLRAALARLRPPGFEAWVTHQVNITAFVGEVPAMGEAVVVGWRDGRVHNLGRLRFES